MKAKRTGKVRRERARRCRFALEALEPRIVLDGQLGTEIAQIAADPADFARFESTDDLQQFLVDAAVDRWKDLFGTETNRWRYTPVYDERLDLISNSPAFADAASVPQTLGQSFDGTNIQVNGVDEADLVKTDGEYLYVANDGRLLIIDVRNPAELSLAAEIQLDTYAGELYVSGDRLVLLSNQYSVTPYVVRGLWFPSDDYGPHTSLAIYDITDRTSPKLIQETTFDGNLTASRRIDDLIYLVTSDQLHLPRPDMKCETIPYDNQTNTSPTDNLVADSFVALPAFWPEFPQESCVYETQDEYLAHVENEILDLAMPSFETTDPKGEVIASGLISKPADTYKPLTDALGNVTSIVVVDLSTETSGISASTSLITDYSSTVYASAQNIYVATNSYEGGGNSSTTLQQFAIPDDGKSVDLVAVGTVPGTLLNQFALDEYEGHLRVVTSTGWGSERTNQLFVLKQLGTSLDVVGSIDEIATGESVFAVRFLGDEAFVVTFRVIDPLFTIDLSDPTSPAIAGELEIPGFSNYLHPISEDLILGLGRDDGGFRGPPQLSLFDVSDFSLPERIDKFVFEGASWSEAFYNHHAISYFPDSQIAVVPFQGSHGFCVDGATFGVCYPRQANAFWVVQIDTASDEKSLHLLGTIEHEDTPLRSVRIGEYLITVSTGTVKATELLQPNSLIDELYFGKIAFMDYVTVDSREREVELDVLHNDRLEGDARIVEVGSSATGAIIEIAGDGKMLLYTPAENSDARNDSFEYTVESGGRRDTTVVQVNIVHEKVADRMVRLAKADLTDRLGHADAAHHIRLTKVSPREWPDSCLGVAAEDVVCAQVITPGFKIVFEYALTEYIYHTDTGDRVIAVDDPVVETEDLIQIRAEVLNSAGEPATSLLVGEEATLQIHAYDLRGDARGVFAAYFDVLFDPAQIAEFGSVNHSADFGDGLSGAIDEAGLIDELGGFNSEADSASTLVVSIPFVAASSGELRFTTQAADVLPAHDSLLLGLNSPIPFDRIRFGEIVIQVVEFLHNDEEPMDANMDGEMTPLDALIVMNHINRHGAGPVNAGVIHALRAAAAEAHATRFAADVNRDGFISPIDVLLIVNALEAHSHRLAEGEAVAAETRSDNLPPIRPVLVTSSAPSQASANTSTMARRITLPSITPPKHESVYVFPLLDELAQAVSQRKSEPDTSSQKDEFFAELAALASTDWWRD
ncbi:MAG: beta-propeller domain-containing protein [Planctomycetota bacterium]|nr:beta-propeller domain-containing protein [Planctomycetota bacterium]